MRSSLPLTILAVATTALIAACSGSDITQPDDVQFPDSNVSYAQHVAPFIAVGCNVSGCHDEARVESGFLRLQTWADVRQTRVINQPGDTNCGLVQVLYGRVIGHPPLSSLIRENQRRGVKQWVIEGAPNN